jgi:hypothetical protein
MITFVVTDLDGYLTALESQRLPARFPGVEVAPPRLASATAPRVKCKRS